MTDLKWCIGVGAIAVLSACPGDEFVDPFAVDTSDTASGTETAGDDGVSISTSPMTTTPDVDTTMGNDTDTIDPTLDGTSSGDESTTQMISDGSSTTDMGEDSSTTDGSSTTDAGTIDDGGMQGAPCPVDTIDMVPGTWTGTTVGEAAEFGSGCGGFGAPDAEYTFTVTENGYYVFDTFGSSIDTILYVLDGECGGAVLACNDDTAPGTQSQVGVALVAGQTVTVVIDGFGLTGGNYTLHATYFGGVCPDGDIGSTVPQTVNGNTSGGDNTTAGSCGGNVAFDDSYTFTAPANAVYVFDTIGSSFDTVLYAFNGNCNGAQLGCNDNITAGNTASRIYANLTAGQQIVVVVDGAGAASGAWTLNVDTHDCPAEDLGSTIPQTTGGTTVGLPNVLSGTCGGAGSPEIGYLFTAPATGQYVINTFGSAYDTLLYVLDGPGCSGPSLACNDDAMGVQSQVTVNLVAGQQISIIVDGFGSPSAGNYTLNISALTGTCPDGDLGSTVPQTVVGDTSMEDNSGGGTCGGLAGNDESWTFTAPDNGIFIFDTIGSATDTILYVRDGTCNGAQLGCNDNTTGLGTASRLIVPLAMGQDVVAVVDGPGAGGPYTLNVAQHLCPGVDIGSTVPQSYAGSTSGLPNVLDGTCSGGTGPDLGHLFTAPATATYVIDTLGSAFDTQLFVLDGPACAGAQLQCNDNSVGLTSQVLVDLVQGQQVSIIVDGFGAGSSGDYVLNIEEFTGTCPNEDLGTQFPVNVMGTTLGEFNLSAGDCALTNAPDYAYLWEAPAAGMYTIDTFGSAYDTLLHVRDGATCNAPQLACNDDTLGLQSQVVVNLAAGQQIVIVVDGYNMSSGNYTLNIN